MFDEAFERDALEGTGELPHPSVASANRTAEVRSMGPFRGATPARALLTRDATRRDLIEANRAIREGDEARDLMRKEIVELKRLVNEEIHEKETVQATAAELRGQIKRVEGEKTELSRLLQEARQRIGGEYNIHKSTIYTTFLKL